MCQLLGTSYSRPPIDPYLTPPCYKILAAPLVVTNWHLIALDISSSLCSALMHTSCPATTLVVLVTVSCLNNNIMFGEQLYQPWPIIQQLLMQLFIYFTGSAKELWQFWCLLVYRRCNYSVLSFFLRRILARQTFKLFALFWDLLKMNLFPPMLCPSYVR